RPYWAWSEDWIAHSLDTGGMRSPMGWTCRTGITEFNARSIGNWSIQAVEADIMRLACVLTARRGIELIGCVHDALVIESSIEKIDEDVSITRECMRRASRIVLNSEHELRTDATVVKYPDRYTAKRGPQMWNEVIGLLEQYHEMQRRKGAAAGACRRRGRRAGVPSPTATAGRRSGAGQHQDVRAEDRRSVRHGA